MRKRFRPAPAGILALALAIRLAGGLSPAPARSEACPAEEPAAAAEPVPIVESAASRLQPLDLRIPAVSEPPPSAPSIPVSAAALETLELRNQTGYTVSWDELAERQPRFNADGDRPTILLIHTHTTEAYTPEPGWEYEPCDVMRTADSRFNMVRIGDEVEQALTEAGFSVIHDERIHDQPSFNGSYQASLNHITAWLEQYPSIQVVLDLHRDAAEDGRGGYVRTSCRTADTDMAQLMLVCGTDYGGLTHPGWRDNLAFAARLQLALEQAQPGLCRPLDLRCERFNQHAAPMSLLVEVGSVGDTLARALPSARLLGETLAGVLRGLES